MRFGLFTLFDYFPGRQNERDLYRDTLALFKESEALGYDSAWVGEEHFYAFGVCPSPQIFLTALARETTTLRLGTAISILPLAHPLRKAEEFAMLDVLSNGRLDFGVAPGGIPAHFAGFDVAMSEMRERYEESLTVIERAWRHEHVSHEGRFWTFPDLSVSPRPVQAPCPPIYRGLLGLPGYALAGTRGHSFQVPPWMSPDATILQGIQDYRAALQAAGHVGVPDPVFMFWMFCHENHHAALAEAREVVLRYRDLIIGNFPYELYKTLPPGDSSRGLYDMLSTLDDHLEERIIAGTPAQCRRRVAELRDRYGAEHMGFYMHAGARDIERARRSMRLFAQEVMPAFKQAARRMVTPAGAAA